MLKTINKNLNLENIFRYEVEGKMKEKSLLCIKAIITSVVLLFVLTNFENIFYKPLIVYAAGTPSNDA